METKRLRHVASLRDGFLVVVGVDNGERESVAVDACIADNGFRQEAPFSAEIVVRVDHDEANPVLGGSKAP